MARKSGTQHNTISRRISGGREDVQWLNIKFEDEEIAIVVEASSDVPGVMSDFAELLAGGHDVSIKRNADRGNYSAFIITAARDDNGIRSGLSAFALTGIEALAAVLLKFHIVTSNPDRATFSGKGVGIG